MTALRETLRCRYQYDPLDRVVGCTPMNRDSVQRFYRKNRLATEIQGQAQYSVFEHEALLLAQRRFETDRVDCALLATDLQRSVLHSIAVGQHQQPVYSPYGYRSPEGGLISLLGFNGECRDPVTGHYLLGNGYRAFNPVLMRFNSPDSLSPFGEGGVNAYAYCGGNPVNWVDPTGHNFLSAFFGKYLQRAAASVPLNAVPAQTSTFSLSLGALNSNAGNTNKTGPAKKLAEIPVKGGRYDASTLEALDLAGSSGQEMIDGKILRRLMDRVDRASKQLSSEKTSFLLLEQDVISKGVDPALTPLRSVHNTYLKAHSAFSKALIELEHREHANFFKYTSHRKSAMVEFNSDVRKGSL